MICKNKNCNRTIEYSDSYKQWFHIYTGLATCNGDFGPIATPTELTEAEKLYQKTPINVEDPKQSPGIKFGPTIHFTSVPVPCLPTTPVVVANENWSLDNLKGLDGATSKATTTNPKDLLGEKKAPLGQVCPVADAHESCAMLDGDLKYGFRNWREKNVVARIYIDAALRHIQAWAEGEEVAEDSGVHHLGHARACLGILLDAQENGNLIDNRARGVFGKVVKRLEGWVKERVKKHNETGK